MPTETNSGGTSQTENEDSQAQSLTFDAWQSSQPDDVRGLIDSHVSGLKNALTEERNQRKELSRKLKEASGQMEAGSAARASLETMTANLDEATQRADFYAAAAAAGVKNLKLAYIAAKTDNLLDDLGGLKTVYPEMFASSRPPAGNAGSGAGQDGAPSKSMNNFIRAAAGRRTS